MLRLLTLGLLGLSAISGVLGAPQSSQGEQGSLCPSLPVQLELRTSPTIQNRYQLVFAAVDPSNDGSKKAMKQADYVDIHYRVNNDDSVNLRVSTQNAITTDNESAKQGQVDGIVLEAGDVIRAYATYFAKGYACDTPVHTFNAPEQKMSRKNVRNRIGEMNIQAAQAECRNMKNYRTNQAAAAAINRRRVQQDYDQYDIQGEDSTEYETMEVCPSIPLDQDIVKISGLDNTYMLTFENKDPRSTLSYVDLHLTTDAEEKGWDNLRLASDMQLKLAHKVMQSGITIKPHEQLKWYWSYRTINPTTGTAIDCTTPVTTIAPHQVTHEISMQQLNAAANN